MNLEPSEKESWPPRRVEQAYSLVTLGKQDLQPEQRHDLHTLCAHWIPLSDPWLQSKQTTAKSLPSKGR